MNGLRSSTETAWDGKVLSRCTQPVLCFLRCEDCEVDVTLDVLTSLSDQVKLLARSYRKESIDRFWEKRMEDMSSMKTPDQIKQFDTSPIARAATKLLGECQGEKK